MFLGFEATGFAALGEGPEDRWAIGGESEMQVDWEVRLFVSTHEFITRPTDTPADQAFKGTLVKAFRIDRSIIGTNRLGEEITIGLGEVTLSNLEGDYDFLAIDHTSQGQAILIKMGDPTKPFATWRTVLSGYMVGQPTITRDTITFRLRDAGHQLDVPLSPNVYLGTGGAEGGSELKDKRKPRCFGWLYEWQPPLVIPASLAYQLNDGQIHQVSNVYVRGVAMLFDADFASVALMNAASLTVGKYATCLAAGWVRIAVASGSEIGQVTCDFAGDKAGGVFVEKTGEIVRRMLGVTTVVDPDDLVVSSFTALNTAQPAPVGYGVAAGSDETVASAVGKLMAGIGGWCGARRSGQFEVRRLASPSLGASTGSYSKLNVDNVQTMPMPSELSPPPWRIMVGWGRIWTPGQTDLAGSVSEARRAYLAQETRFASAESANVKNDFPPGHDLTKAETFFRDEADALAEATRLGALFWVPRAIYVFKLSEKLFIHELGQGVTLQFDDRFDLDTPKKLGIVDLSEDDGEGVTMTAWG